MPCLAPFMHKDHAHVKIGDYDIPLIGVDRSATTYQCDGCGENKEVWEIHLDYDGCNFYCRPCMMVKGTPRPVRPAPEWLKERMEKIKAMPPSTLEKMRAYFKASANWEYDHRHDNIFTLDSKGRKIIR